MLGGAKMTSEEIKEYLRSEIRKRLVPLTSLEPSSFKAEEATMMFELVDGKMQPFLVPYAAPNVVTYTARLTPNPHGKKMCRTAKRHAKILKKLSQK